MNWPTCSNSSAAPHPLRTDHDPRRTKHRDKDAETRNAMTTITLWLLVSLGSSSTPSNLIDRFADAKECQRVEKALTEATGGFRRHLCVQATVVQP